MSLKELCKKVGGKTLEYSTKAINGYASGCNWLEAKVAGPEGCDGKLDRAASWVGSKVKPATQKVANATHNVASQIAKVTKHTASAVKDKTIEVKETVAEKVTVQPESKNTLQGIIDDVKPILDWVEAHRPIEVVSVRLIDPMMVEPSRVKLPPKYKMPVSNLKPAEPTMLGKVKHVLTKPLVKSVRPVLINK